MNSSLVDTRLLTVNKAAINHGRLSLSSCGHDFFPKNAIGGSSKDAQASKLIQLHASPSEALINTDLASDLNGKMRWMFRSRSWFKAFSQASKLKEGDKVLIYRTSPYQYRITPAWKAFRFIDLFAGIGGIRIGFESAGGRCVFSSEFDELACDTYEANFGERPSGDITCIDPKDIPDHDILLAGFPCQPFSIIGNRKGFGDTRGTLFFNIEQILKIKQPTAILLENVKQFRTHDEGRTFRTVIHSLEALGYHIHTAVLNALDYGAPQKRERTFIVGFKENLEFRFPKPFKYYPPLSDILEDDNDIDKSLFASDYIQKKRLNRLIEQGREPFYPSMWHENKGGHIGLMPYSFALRANASYNYLLVNGKRRPSGRECLRFQGYPESFRIVVPHAAIRAQAGNSVAVPAIKAIATEMVKSLKLKLRRYDTLFETISEHNFESARIA